MLGCVVWWYLEDGVSVGVLEHALPRRRPDHHL